MDHHAGPSDLDLIQGVAAGSEASFRMLFRRWSPRLGSYLRQATGSREVAEDLLQEAFLRILRAAPGFEPRGKVSSWMYRICTNLVYSYWRRRQRSPIRAFEPRGREPQITVPATDRPDGRHLRGAFSGELRSALEHLTPNHRTVFLLKVERGLTYQEIAGILRCPEGTAKSRFHHAVRQLRAELREWADGLITEVEARGGDDMVTRYRRRAQRRMAGGA